jgi:hypothetical protein
MKLRKKLLLLVGAIAVGGVVFVVFQPGPTYDIRKVHPRLANLRQPYRSVKTYYWADGGSIGIRIVDQGGNQEQFAIRAKLGESDRYARVYAGALNDSLPGAVEIGEPEHTRRMLTRILGDYHNRTPWDDANLTELRGYPRDYIMLWYHRLCGHLDANGVYIY